MPTNTSILSSNLTNFFLWTILPPFLSSSVLKIYYFLFPSSRPTVSPSSTPPEVAFQNARAQLHARNARIALVTLYLIYTIMSSYIAQSSQANMNYYSLLALPRTLVDEGGPAVVKSHWRKLARVYHPDKVGKAGEPHFVMLRKGVEVLEDDKKRWAYERFGEDVARWGLKNASERDYLVQGFQGAGGFYVIAFGSVAAIAFFRKEERANSFWRYYSLTLTLVLEFFLLLQSAPSPLFAFLIPNRLPFEQIAVLRQVFISASMAMSQLTPLLYPADPKVFVKPGQEEEVRWRQEMELLGPALERLEKAAIGAELEVVGLMRMEMQPLFRREGDGETSENEKSAVPDEERKEREQTILDGVRTHMETLFKDMRFKNSPATNQIWGNAVKTYRSRESIKKMSTTLPAEVDKAATLDRLRGTNLSPPPSGAKNGAANLTSKIDAQPGRLPSPPPEGTE